MSETNIFSEIPMRTWRWLGVNEVQAPENVPADIEKQQLHVEAGKQADLILTNRESKNVEIEATVEAGGTLNLIHVQMAPDNAPYASRVHITLGKAATLNYTVVEAGAVHTVSELTVDMEGDDSRADIWGLYFGDEARKIDINYVVRQGGKRTDANMQVRGALMGSCEKLFRGTLDFLEGSKGSVGREDEEVVILSEGTRNRSVPVMLSHEDDVDGHHAVSVGKMDEAKLFYLMSRGLDLAEARRLVVEASFNPVLDRIEDEALREEIETYLQRRLSHD